MTLKDIADLGATGFLAVSVWLLWRRLGEVTDRLFVYLEEGRSDRQEIAKANGLSTQDLTEARAQAVKRLDRS